MDTRVSLSNHIKLIGTFLVLYMTAEIQETLILQYKSKAYYWTRLLAYSTRRVTHPTSWQTMQDAKPKQRSTLYIQYTIIKRQPFKKCIGKYFYLENCFCGAFFFLKKNTTHTHTHTVGTVSFKKPKASRVPLLPADSSLSSLSYNIMITQHFKTHNKQLLH